MIETTPAEETLRLRFDIAYDGTSFHGWASQRNAADGTPLRTVQGILESALSLIVQSPIHLTVAGRTDAGVHATGQVAHADISRKAIDHPSFGGDPDRIVRRLAKLLPDDVRVVAVREVPALFDARFAALTRRYVYRVTTHPSGALPSRRLDTAVWTKPVDLELMQATADRFVGLHDFAAFCRARPHATTIRHVDAMTWKEVSTREEPCLYEANISADAFCWNMVRALVATCLEVGQGRRDADWAGELLLETQRNPRVALAPAKGLTLAEVTYPPDNALAQRMAVTRRRRDESCSRG